MIGGLIGAGAGVGTTLMTGSPVLGKFAAGGVGKMVDRYNPQAEFSDVDRVGVFNPGINVRNLMMSPGMNLGFGPSQFGPYANGYQMPGQPPPTTSGLPDRDMGYAQLPNYGGPTNLPSVQAQPHMRAEDRFAHARQSSRMSGQFNPRNYIAAKPSMGGGGGAASVDQVNHMLRARSMTQ